jgi:hypothetical protein
MLAIPSSSLFTITLAALGLGLGTTPACAAPTTVKERQNGVQLVDRCYNSGQVALTYDGESPHLFLS